MLLASLSFCLASCDPIIAHNMILLRPFTSVSSRASRTRSQQTDERLLRMPHGSTTAVPAKLVEQAPSTLTEARSSKTVQGFLGAKSLCFEATHELRRR